MDGCGDPFHDDSVYRIRSPKPGSVDREGRSFIESRDPAGSAASEARGAVRSVSLPVIMKAKKRKVQLPIGRIAMLTYQVNALRDECCGAASLLMSQKPLNEAELEECARLDDALAEAHHVLRRTLARVTLSRLKRRSQTR